MADRLHNLSSPLKLLLVSNTVGSTFVQGADRDWVNLLNALGPKRVQVTWAGVSQTDLLCRHLDQSVVTRYLDLDFYPFGELFHGLQYKHRTLRNWLGLTLGYGRDLLRPLRILRREMRNDPPDLVVTNTSVVLVGAAYARLARKPHVWCVKEFLDPNVPSCRRFARLIERLSTAVVVPSKAMTAAFSARALVLHDGNNIAAIRSNIREIDRAQVLRKLNLPAERPVIAQVGAVSEAKGQHLTAEAFSRLAARGGKSCSLLFLGPSTQAQRERLLLAMNDAPEEWRANVRFLEFESGDFSYLWAADIVVHPSVLPDPYPNAVREALILGKPVIGSRVGGIPDLITDGVTGILIAPHDVAGLTVALETLIDSMDERKRLGKAAEQFAAKILDVNVCKEAFFKLLLEATGKAGDFLNDLDQRETYL